MATQKKSKVEYSFWINWVGDDYFTHSRALEKMFPRVCTGSGCGPNGADVTFRTKKKEVVAATIAGLLQYAEEHGLRDVEFGISVETR